MKNYKVKALLRFKDLVEDKEHLIGELFECTKERYEELANKNIVELVEKEQVVKTENVEKPKKKRRSKEESGK